MCYSLWYNAPTMLLAGSLEAELLRFQATDRHCNRCIIPQDVIHSLVLLKMGKIIARNILS
jgi:1-deoxy-D-xylulose 5-phosphate reductoisomerase